jgi:hypothetical protein
MLATDTVYLPVVSRPIYLTEIPYFNFKKQRALCETMKIMFYVTCA